jgi:adenine-specific DNA-methyltransferase
MPELNFKGKEFVYNHHLSVPFRPLLPDTEKSIGDGGLDGNLIIQGDNLHALKALLPTYTGKVDCIFIDPPYNTGNESWSYSDNVNSPMIKEWLNDNPIGIEDGLRHDKWLSMMWPRLRLLHELLSEQGSIWITLDDNEVAHARLIMDEIFGSENFVTTIIWQKVYSPKNTARHFSEDHDYMMVYAKDAETWTPNLLPRTEEMEKRYINPDNDPRGLWKPSDLTARNPYSKGKYKVTGSTGKTFDSGTRYWRQSYESFLEMDRDNRIWWGEEGNNMPSQKRFLSEVKDGLVPQTLWKYSDAGHTQDAKKELLAVMNYPSDEEVFVTPKPVKLVERVVKIATKSDSIVIDSFAGSGTTALAVMVQNAKDGGHRKFILAEMEDYADELTAERVRRVINGYTFAGTQREELLREKLSWSKLQNVDVLLKKVQAFDNMDSHRFDRIKKEVKDGELIVTGEKSVKEKTEGLGGSFTYCTLGEPLELDKLLTGETLPAANSLGSVLFHMATSEPFDSKRADSIDLGIAGHSYLGESSAYHVWLIYQPDLEFLKSREAALTLDKARRMTELLPGKEHLVFAPARFVSQKMLREHNLPVEFAPLPFALYRMELGQSA